MLLCFTLAFPLLPLTLAGHFDGYPIDSAQSLDDDLVTGVLNEFYLDSTSLGATCSASQRRSRDYSRILTEMSSVVSVDEFKQQIGEVITLLQMNARRNTILEKSDSYLQMQKNTLRSRLVNQTKVMTAQSYLHYAKAEAYRLMRDYVKALSQISDASIIRQRVAGISLDELQRLHALILIQRVSKFNHEADRLLRVPRGPDSAALARLKALFINTTKPTGEWVCRRTSLEDFGENCIEDKTVDRIFCEFADKLRILGISSSRDVSTDRRTPRTEYRGVIDEVKKIHQEFASDLEKQVVDKIGIDYGREALNGADKLVGRLHDDYVGWAALGSTSRASLDRLAETSKRRSLETYTKYFKAEIYRRSTNCNFLILAELMLERVGNLRRQYDGISVGKLLELEGKIAFRSLVCFHKRMESIYTMQGDEGDSDGLERRTIHNGGSENTLRPSDAESIPNIR